MKLHTLQPSGVPHATPGDFRFVIVDDAALLPDDIACALRGLSVTTIEEFISVLQAYPSSFAKQIGWSPETVAAARNRLIEEIRGKVEDVYLETPPDSGREFGAIEPKAAENTPVFAGRIP